MIRESSLLPGTTLPTDWCCGHQTHLRSTRMEVQSLPPMEQIRTTNRYVVITRWQCHVVEAHSGEWWKTTDDPDAPLPYRTVDDPSKWMYRFLRPLADFMRRRSL